MFFCLHDEIDIVEVFQLQEGHVFSMILFVIIIMNFHLNLEILYSSKKSVIARINFLKRIECVVSHHSSMTNFRLVSRH
jgi:hypothetical protein